MLRDSGPRVRWSAVRVLQKFAERIYRTEVEKLLDDPDRDVRLAATEALPSFDGREPAPLHPPDGTPSFSRLATPKKFVHGGYARLVGRALGSLDGATHWSAALSLGRLPARTGVEDLVALGSHPEPEVRRSAAWILDHWASRDAVKALQKASETEKDPGVLQAIRDALARAAKE